jgi:FkbM family methyltransferase
MIFLKNFIKNISKIKSIKDINFLKKELKEPIYLVDVGSTGGIEDHFKEIEELLHVITFDPDPRADTVKTKGKFENFNIGLWSKKDIKKLYLKKYPQASTFYNLNETLLSSFLNYPCHENVGEQDFEVNSLENILIPKNIYPDFIKVDAEGADLEILKGSKKFLNSSCLGIQCEVSFATRHLDAPYFSDIDEYLRKFGFVLMKLDNERWIRKNNCFSSVSNPQIVWGNAVYVLSKERFIEMITNLSLEKKEQSIIKFITLLLIFKFHDYASDILDNLFTKKLISEDFYKKINNYTIKSIPSNFKCYTKAIFSIFISMSIMALLFVFPQKRRKSFLFFKEKIRSFAKLILNVRYGPNDTCL